MAAKLVGVEAPAMNVNMTDVDLTPLASLRPEGGSLLVSFFATFKDPQPLKQIEELAKSTLAKGVSCMFVLVCVDEAVEEAKEWAENLGIETCMITSNDQPHEAAELYHVGRDLPHHTLIDCNGVVFRNYDVKLPDDLEACFQVECKTKPTASSAAAVPSDCIHAKFSGYRLQEPGDALPDCKQFAKEPADESIYGGWTKLDCSDQERELCLELLSKVVSIGGPQDPITLLRYLRARDKDVAKAAEMYKKSMEWRASDGRLKQFEQFTIDDSLHRRFDECYKGIGTLGRDLNGNPVIYDRPGLADVNVGLLVPTSFMFQHEIYTTTRFLQAMDEVTRSEGRPYMYFTCVSDMTGLGWKHCNMTAMNKFKECAVLQDYFPEMIGKIIIVNAPKAWSWIWKVIKHLLDKKTADKVEVVDDAAVLTKYIDPKWIPQSLGGTCCVQGNPYCEPLLTKCAPLPMDLLAEIKKQFP